MNLKAARTDGLKDGNLYFFAKADLLKYNKMFSPIIVRRIDKQRKKINRSINHSLLHFNV